MNASANEPAQAYLQLRNRVLNLDPSELGLAPTRNTPHVWGVVIEMGYEVGSATLIALADGTTSLYYSTGGGLLGSGEYLPVAQAAKSLVAEAEISLPQMAPSTKVDLPEVGQVRLTLRTYTGDFSSEAPEETLVTGEHSLSPLFARAQECLKQLRLLTEKKRKSV